MFTDICGEVVGTIFTIQKCNTYLEKMGLKYFSNIRVRLVHGLMKPLDSLWLI